MTDLITQPVLFLFDMFQWVASQWVWVLAGLGVLIVWAVVSTVRPKEGP